MNPPETQTISVIIPCYNEADKIAGCLNHLMSQTIKPLEILVIDNNCSDETVLIAKEFPLVKIIKESKQGLISARNKGFEEAKGTILARIDADTHVSNNWLATMDSVFKNNPDIKALSGTGYFYDAYMKKISKYLRNTFAVWMNRLILGHHMLWGSNMALKKSAWLDIKNVVHNNANIMEDLDLAIHINNKYGQKSISYNSGLLADISIRRATASLEDNYYYFRMWPHTLKMHGKKFYLVSWIVAPCLVILKPLILLITRAYDQSKDRLVLSKENWKNNKNYTRPNP